MFERLIIYFVTQIASYLMTKALEKSQKSQETVATDSMIDQKLEAVKNAYKESFNGEPVTKEQRKKLKDSIVDFISTDSGGL